MNIPAATSSVCRLIPLILECAKEYQYVAMHRLIAQLKTELKFSTDQEKPDIGVVLATLIQDKQFSLVGSSEELHGSNGGFTMAVFSSEEVPIGSKLYIKKDV